MRTNLLKAARFQLTDDYVRIANRWESGATGPADEAKLLESMTDRLRLQRLIDGSSAPETILARVSDQQILGDWVAAADFFATQQVGTETKGELMDRVCAAWGKRQGIEYPSAWLLEPRTGPEFETPRLWAAIDSFSKFPSTSVKLLALLPEERRKEGILAIASQVTSPGELDALAAVADPALLAQLKLAVAH